MTSQTEPTPEIVAEKRALRAAAEARRARLHESGGAAAAASFVARFRAAWSPAPGTVIAGFWPFRSELDLRPLLRRVHDDGCTVALPVVVARRKPLAFRVWTPETQLETGQFGVPVPPDTAPTVEPDWLLVPLLAFDDAGYRLGYGGGFYDVTLAARRRRKPVLAIGVAYDGQRVERVPRDPTDARLDAIVTERRVLIVET